MGVSLHPAGLKWDTVASDGRLVAVLSIFAALAVLAGEVDAAFADGDEPPTRRAASDTAAASGQGTTSPRRIA
jgi:hypothetical protein